MGCTFPGFMSNNMSSHRCRRIPEGPNVVHRVRSPRCQVCPAAWRQRLSRQGSSEKRLLSLGHVSDRVRLNVVCPLGLRRTLWRSAVTFARRGSEGGQTIDDNGFVPGLLIFDRIRPRRGGGAHAACVTSQRRSFSFIAYRPRRERRDPYVCRALLLFAARKLQQQACDDLDG
jgi:hypothetical protein